MPRGISRWRGSVDRRSIAGFSQTELRTLADQHAAVVAEVTLQPPPLDHDRTPELRTLIEIGAPPDFDGAVCSRCGVRFRLQKDHMDPKNHGGPLSFENLDPLCPVCHGEKTKEDWEAGLLGLEARLDAEARAQAKEAQARQAQERDAEGRGPP